MDEYNHLEREIFYILVTKDSIAMQVAPLNPDVIRLMNTICADNADDKIDVVKHLYWNIVALKKNTIIEPLSKENTFIVQHTYASTTVKMILEFQHLAIFHEMDVQLKTKSRNVSIKIDMDRIPDPGQLEDMVIKTKFVTDAVAAVHNVFNKHIFDRLDVGKSINPSNSSSRSSTGSSTPGCVYLG